MKVETDSKLKGNFLILILCLVLLGLISIFYVGAPVAKKAVPEILSEEPRPLTNAEIENIGKNIDPKTLSRPLSDREINNIGKGINPKSLSRPLSNQEIEAIGR